MVVAHCHVAPEHIVMPEYDGVAIAKSVADKLQTWQIAIRTALQHEDRIIDVWNPDPQSPENRARFNKPAVRARLYSGLGHAPDSLVEDIAQRVATDRFNACRRRFAEATDAYAMLLEHKLERAYIVKACVTNPNWEAPLMEFIAINLTNCEFDVYIYARSKGLKHAEAVTVLLRNRTETIEAVELDGTVYAIKDAAAAGAQMNPVVAPDPWKDFLWKRRWQRLLREQHPRVTEKGMPGFDLEFMEEQPTAMDVLIAPSPVVMLVWASSEE